ncbi:MAG: SpoIIIAC/SpoIIIAD family protein [Clostridiales bacterium]|nr:SpoIIIAC/SpoIIIAD family protein [Clostridiales bacterium]
MNDIFRMAGFSVIAALIAFTLRAAHRQAGAAAALAAGMMLFFFAVTRLSQAANALRALAEKSGVENEMLMLMLKMVGLAYITEFSVQACQDAGENGLAAKAGLCGKMLLMLETLPLITRIGELVLSFSL